ncbi:RNA polymerase sigma-70 factor, Rhodopirellula/Verrucomicrobium family [Rubritalea squalenifaciens DSM 18772]|uniref:RNA polymerase sigma-70 factor, Rhodopirellula/Verrucomicrobium family n=3 Tax=Rubritaleaceae TaxID=1648490 RepID=A0A1M6LHP4_9BACT|nr:RNA polymerase sigma-70 factor, Rhodopirellula/Verrucomicrobium family [Rubritalea squalenifaciens DSM 18772]
MSDSGTFEELLVAHQGFIRGMVISLGVLRHDADDLVQQVNVKLFNMQEQYEQGTNFKAWVASVCRFTCLSYFRDKQRRPHLDMSEQALDALQETYIQHYEQMDQRYELLEICLQSMPQKDRDVLREFYKRGESIKEIAEQLKKSAVAMRKYISRLRKSLKECIERRLK